MVDWEKSRPYKFNSFYFHEFSFFNKENAYLARNNFYLSTNETKCFTKVN